MVGYHGSVKVVPLHEKLPSYMGVERGGVIICFPECADEMHGWYDENKYAKTVIDVLYNDYGESHDTVEEFIDYIVQISRVDAGVDKTAFVEELVQ